MNNIANLGIFFAGFFGGIGVFFVSCGYLWRTSLRARAMKKKDLI